MKAPADLYDEWNTLLLKEYFGASNDGERVWIQAVREELDDFGFRHGGVSGLIDAVKKGPSFSKWAPNRIAIIVKFLVRQRKFPSVRISDYRDPGQFDYSFKDLNAPAYMPYVAVFVLAASEGGVGGYYSKISELMGYDFEGSEESRDLLNTVWNDLSQWTNELDGRYGKFSSLKIGRHAYVGLAKAQALVTHKDRSELPKIFSNLSLKPGQELTAPVLEQITESVVHSDQCSKGLREACADLGTYGEALRDIFAFRVANWEGNVGPQRSAVKGVAKVANPEIYVLMEESFEGWSFGWWSRLESGLEAARLATGDSKCEGIIDASRGHIIFSSKNMATKQAAVTLLTDSASSKQSAEIDFEYSGDDRLGSKITHGLPHRSIRGLSWMQTSVGQALAECGMPIAGPLFLLSQQTNLKHQLGDLWSKLLPTDDSVEGLPPGWNLWVIEDVEHLSSSDQSTLQRSIGDHQGVGERARISFVRGSVIQRAGQNLYLDYDLPDLEVQMPPNAVLESSGLMLTEISPNIADKSNRKHIHTFFYSTDREDGSTRLQFEVWVKQGSEVLCKRRIKIAPEAGGAIGEQKDFAVGPYGEVQSGGEGLKGLMLKAQPQSSGITINNEYSKPLLPERWDLEVAPENSLQTRFLNTLALKQSLLFGQAKTHINRLNSASTEKWVSPISFLFDMRALGHIDIETDSKGHLVRIHACEPIAYQTFDQSGSEFERWRLTGSFTQLVWSNLRTAKELKVIEQKGVMHIFWESPDSRTLRHFARNNGFTLLDNPSEQILYWAGAIEALRLNIKSRSIAERTRASNLERFAPRHALFSKDSLGSMRVDEQKQVELFRLDDPIIPSMRAYMIGSIIESGGARFSYIEDSRWAVWLAFTSFLKNIAEPIFPDIYPWPVRFDSETSTLYLPARLKLPSVLERAMCSCSGLLPKEAMCFSRKGTSENLELQDAETEETVTVVPNFYEEMAEGKWLIYQGIPEQMASVLLSKLECKIWSPSQKAKMEC